jgi:N-acetylglucosamine malate deacetylase 1
MNKFMTDILAFGAHPDDLEFGCGGILAKMSMQGKTIVMADLTLGEKGSHGTAQERRREAESSARIIGAERIFLDFSDCEIMDSYEGRLKLVTVIRKYRPRLILAPLWKGEQNHPDHLACGLMVRYACRYSRFAKILPELPIHQPEGVLHYLYPTYDNPDFIVDISEEVEVWKRMMTCFESQMKTFQYIDWNLRLAAKLGILIGTSYAQGLMKGNPIQVDDVMTLAKGTREM